MLRISSFVVGMLGYVTVAYGQPMHLTVGQAEDILGALKALSAGQDVITKDAKGDSHTVKQPYKGWSLATITAMIRDIQILTPPVQTFDDAKATKARELAAPDGTIPPGKLGGLMKEIDEQKKTSLGELDLQAMKLGDLNAEVNELPPAVLANLGPLLDMSGK